MKHFFLIFLSLCFFSISTSHADEASIGDKKRGKVIYDNLCAYCHKLNGAKSLVGAFGLQDIGSRRSDAWLNSWLKAPGEFAKKNVDAKELIDDENAILVMPTLPDMQDEQKRLDVIEYIKTL